jgi:histone-lysine N-methyltransferase SETMAR
MEWRSTNSPEQNNIRLQKSGLKTTLIVVFDIGGVIHKELISQGTTVNSHCYLGVMQRLYKGTCRERRDLLDTKSWLLLHDNAPSHCALNVKHLLAKEAITAIEHPTYLHDLAPADYFLFPRIKRALKGQRFDVIKAIQRE